MDAGLVEWLLESDDQVMAFVLAGMGVTTLATAQNLELHCFYRLRAELDVKLRNRLALLQMDAGLVGWLRDNDLCDDGDLLCALASHSVKTLTSAKNLKRDCFFYVCAELDVKPRHRLALLQMDASLLGWLRDNSLADTQELPFKLVMRGTTTLSEMSLAERMQLQLRSDLSRLQNKACSKLLLPLRRLKSGVRAGFRRSQVSSCLTESRTAKHIKAEGLREPLLHALVLESFDSDHSRHY